MVGSDMTPSLPLKQSLSGAVYSGSSASSWSKLGSVARGSTRNRNLFLEILKELKLPTISKVSKLQNYRN
jgi:hypothetical protein